MVELTGKKLYPNMTSKRRKMEKPDLKGSESNSETPPEESPKPPPHREIERSPGGGAFFLVKFLIKKWSFGRIDGQNGKIDKMDQKG